MRIPLEIVFRDVQKSEILEDLIRSKVAKLEQICDYMISCHIAIEKPQKFQKSGNPYRVRIDMRIPAGHELVVKHEPGHGDLHDPLETVLRQQFEVAAKKLQALVDKQHGHVKRHMPPVSDTGLVVRIFDEDGYGFIKALDGIEVFFHRNSVLHNDFDRLEVGTEVRFESEEGDKGPQARSVQILSKPDVRVKHAREVEVEE